MTMALDPAQRFDFSPLHRLQWEESQQKYVILYPEGMVELNGPAAEILKLCDGSRNLDAIVSELDALALAEKSPVTRALAARVLQRMTEPGLFPDE